MIRLVAILTLALALAGCGWAERRTKLKLPPLPQFKEEVDIDRVWSSGFGSNKGNLYPGLRPFVDAGVVYVASPSGKVAAIDAGSGKKLWQRSHKKVKLSGGPGAGDGIVAVGDNSGMLHAHSASDGSHLWSVQLSSEILSAPAVGYDQVVARAADGQVFGLSAESGATLWAQSFPQPALTIRGNSSPVLVENSAITGFDNGNLTIIDLDSGRLLWEQSMSAGGGETELDRVADIDGTPLVVGDNIALASYQRKVHLINAISGRAVWNYPASTNQRLAADGDSLYVVDDDGVILALDLGTGDLRWTQEAFRNHLLAGAAAVGGYLAFGDSKGNVHWLAKDDGRIVGRNKISGAITAAPLSYSEDTIVAFSSSGTVAALRVRPLEKP